MNEFLSKAFRGFGVLKDEECEDRSLHVNEQQRNSFEQEISAGSRLLEEDDEEEEISNLSLCHKIFIAPGTNLLEKPEIIIVPHKRLYRVPFAALSEKGRKCLSETHRIRIVPSLLTLRIIQESPTDYHSQTDVLIVGWLGDVQRRSREVAGVVLC